MKSSKIFLFLALVIALLAGLCAAFPAEGVAVAGTTLHFPSLTRILNPQRQMDVEAYLAEQDSLAEVAATRQDSIATLRSSLDSSDIRFWFPDGDDTFFDPLFAQMEQARTQDRILRVLHYGDSQIEMDRMTNRLRAYMQGIFGGGGPGLTSFATIIPSYSLSLSANGSLRRQSSFGDSNVARARGNYGPMLQDFRVTGNATTNLTATTNRSADDRVRQFSRFTLLFNNRPGPLHVTFTDRKGGYTDEQDCPLEGVQALHWQLDSASTAVRIAVSGTADLYGVLVDDGPGVAVDNIPLRGSSGQQFKQINEDQLTAAYSQMDVGLVILQFGGNAVPYLKGARGMSSYCKTVAYMIDCVHRCCPEAKVLFVGPSDMSTREGGVMQSYPYLPTIVDSLRATANAHGAAYWSIYHAMGGLNSMTAWVSQGLGGADYLHFSQRGADVMGDRLARAFDNMYRLYLMRRRSHNNQ